MRTIKFIRLQRGGTILNAISLGLALAISQYAPFSVAQSPIMEEVVVTATKREATVKTAASAVSVVGSDEMAPGGVTDVDSLMTEIPNLSVGDQFGTSRIFIRGIGMTSIDLGADGAVAVHQDGALIPRPAAQMAGYYDLERVEVLRGPQGTLYGRGATAGAIDLITKRPTSNFEGKIEATAGNYSHRELEGILSGPITDGISGRLVLRSTDRDGFGENKFTGTDIDDRDAFAVRASLLFDVSQAMEVYVTAERFEEDDNNYAFHYFGPTVVPEDQLPFSLLGGETIFDVTGDNFDRDDLRDIYSDVDPINDRKGTTVNINFTYHGKRDWSLKSITSWRKFERFNRTDLDGSNVWMYGRDDYAEESESFSQEFIWSKDYGRFDVLGGLMYFEEDLDGSVQVRLVNLGVTFGLPADFFNDSLYWQNGNIDISAWGAYLQSTIELSRNLALTAGVRYNYEEREGTGEFQFDALGILIPTDKSKDWDDITPRLTLEYTLGDNTMLYGTVTRGFKSGVINVGSQNDVIDPEYVLSYEAGLKSTLIDGRLYFALSGFYYDYEDLQVGFVNEQSIVETINAAEATNVGVEFEATYQVTDDFFIDFFATWLDAEFDKFITGDYRQGNTLRDLEGNRLPNAPEYTFKVGANYYQNLGDQGSLVWRADVNWQDEVYFTEFNYADAYQDSYTMVSASVNWTSASGGYEVSAWGRNLTDKTVMANNIVSAPLYGSVRIGSMKSPRTYGLTATYNF